MNLPRSSLDRTQQRQLARFERMGLAARPMPDGLSLLVSLPLKAEPLSSIDSPMLPRRVVFATVGANEIKCLRPRALFGLPLLDIRRCADANSIESKIRQAWRERTNELSETRSRLSSLGIELEPIAENSVLAFALPGDSTRSRIIMQRLGEAILPSTGVLSGLPLESAEQRILEVSDCFDSGSDLEGRIELRLSELREHRERAIDAERSRRQHASAADLKAPRKRQPNAIHHRPKVMIVGPQVTLNEELIGEFERQGYRANLCVNEADALQQLSSMTPDLVVSQYTLGRSDGASLVQAMVELPGIERIPVVLLDDDRNDARREVARAVGAAGYLTEPDDTQRFVARLRHVVQEPAGRRYTRYPQRLAARLEGDSVGCLVTEVSRGGVFIATPRVLESLTTMRAKVAIPELGHALTFEGEVRYCADAQGTTRQGVGLRFFRMSLADESIFIDYLRLLDSRT